MKRRTISIALLLLTLLSGCSSPQQQTPPAPPPTQRPAPSPEPSSPLRVSKPTVIRNHGHDDPEIQTFAFADPQHGWIAVGDQILATKDGGKTWTDRGHIGSTIRTLELITPDLGWVGTEKGIYVPAKSGDGWEQIEIGTVTDIDFVDESHGWATGKPPSTSPAFAVASSLKRGSSTQ